jgi:putative flippase GtrA
VPRFIAINLGGLAITMTIVYCLVEYGAVWYLTARIISLFMVLFYSYTMHRTITFRN